TGLKITPEQLEKAITSKTRMLIMTSPSNPTGMVYTAAELKPLIEICKKHKIFMLSDEIYEYMVYGDTEFVSPVTLDPSIKPMALIANGLSKSFAMTGWRVGFAAAPKEIVKAMEVWQSQSLTHITSFVQYAAIEALDGSRDFVHMMRDQLNKQRQICLNALRDMSGVTCSEPHGAFYCFPNVSAFVGKTDSDGNKMTSSQDICTYLLTKAHVATVPGEGFGAPGFLRISYACDVQKLQTGLQRIAKALQNLK
ncbi:MAG: aspartate aminotransferase, partial [Deltaproteobacteria bacterium CG11_big_fil_rev_8_21_14_0_20_47_16]